MKNGNLRTLWWVLPVGLAPVGQAMGESPSSLEVHGYLQADLAAQYASPADESLLPESGEELADRSDFAGDALLTIGVRNTNREFAKVEGSLDLMALYGRYADLYLQSQAASGAVLTTGSAPLIADLRTLSLSVYLPRADFSIGRQIINFGTGLVFSPIDVFTGIDLLELNFRRHGSDTARLRVPFSDVGGLELVAGLPVGDAEHASALKLFNNVRGWDLSTVVLQRHEGNETLGGLTFKGDAIVGVNGELVEHYDWDDERFLFEGMLGADYSIRNRLFLNAEYYYRQEGLPANSFYDEHNLFASLRYSINDLTSVSVSALAAFPSDDLLLTAQLFYNIRQNVDTVFYVRAYDIASLEAALPDYEAALRVTVKY